MSGRRGSSGTTRDCRGRARASRSGRTVRLIGRRGADTAAMHRLTRLARASPSRSRGRSFRQPHRFVDVQRAVHDLR